MANKGGTSNFFVRIFLVGFLLVLLLVGALLSVFYRGDGNIFILIALVVIPAVGLLVMYFIRYSWLFRRDKAERNKGEYYVPPLSNATTIEIYGSEFADPYYKQLTMPNFVGKPLPKRSRPKSSSARTKPTTKATYIDYQDKYNGVEQAQMSFANWTDVLRDDPVVVEQGERVAVLSGKLTDDVLHKYQDDNVASESDMEADILLPAWDDENKGKVFSTKRHKKSRSEKSANSDVVVQENFVTKEITPTQISKSKKVRSSVGVLVLGSQKSAKSKTTVVSKNTVQKKILIHKKPKIDKRDDYVFQKLPNIDTNQPIKSLLNEQFEYLNISTTHSASQELLSKMRRDNIRR